MRLRSVCPSLSGKNGLRDENEKGMAGCGSGMRLSWMGRLRDVRGRERGRRKKDAFRLSHWTDSAQILALVSDCGH